MRSKTNSTLQYLFGRLTAYFLAGNSGRWKSVFEEALDVPGATESLDNSISPVVPQCAETRVHRYTGENPSSGRGLSRKCSCRLKLRANLLSADVQELPRIRFLGDCPGLSGRDCTAEAKRKISASAIPQRQNANNCGPYATMNPAGRSWTSAVPRIIPHPYLSNSLES
ncbi:hypothetical protein KM043_010806 [Ampulex compressa]|nr:hypothetical protein KM043_010806 [Ampulex compressa]